MCVGAGEVKATIVLPDNIADQLQSTALNPLETAGVLLVSVVETEEGDIRLLGREIHWVGDSAYLRREYNSLSIASHGYVNALGRAEQLGACAVWLHTHPGLDSQPIPSSHDDIVDGQIADVFRLRSNSPYYGALIISPCSGGFSFTGHLDSEDGRIIKLDRLWIVGNRFRLVQSFDIQSTGLSPAFDRNVRAFGHAVQETLSDLRIGIVGCGGTGSIIAEQLIRLGIRQLVLIDPDELSTSNLTRVYGSTSHDVGKPKVKVLADHLQRIAENAVVEQVQGMLTLEPVAKRLLGSDVIFGCTDDNAGRLILSRLATYLLTPVIDSGVLITSGEEGRLEGIHGRVTILTPGQACLICRNRIDLPRAAAELLTPEERSQRADEGYAPALGRIEPAVVAFTTAIGAQAVGELLERLIGYGSEPRPSEVLLRCHEREISTNIAAPRERHYCHPLSGKVGAGVSDPFLEQTWPA
jgi:molybdopterin/thiamine biosynthesis adenylyltransferase